MRARTLHPASAIPGLALAAGLITSPALGQVVQPDGTAVPVGGLLQSTFDGRGEQIDAVVDAAVTPETTVRDVMQLMTARRFRHVPVLERGRVIAMLSIGDLTRWVARDQRRTIDDLTDYIVRAG